MQADMARVRHRSQATAAIKRNDTGALPLSHHYPTPRLVCVCHLGPLGKESPPSQPSPTGPFRLARTGPRHVVGIRESRCYSLLLTGPWVGSGRLATSDDGNPTAHFGSGPIAGNRPRLP